ncbi:cytosine/purines/uracil/thiamine/allantoin transporter [Novosphingobium sp. Rr 2-17]|uniref:purine-cytosine permease family protein n=1 Tax=Novosphingobium sp. Rr 2-17 TaxID=555793 RepID=UPI00026981A5|nr:cytosine permease [Novosphingobium sp. Rr 2-17]EIZ80112.1 cytosine/purines/uracil/thiamine/allantoin transporter [Novosphingobium sp. Rr 2-17]
MTAQTGSAKIETNTIFPIPASERHGNGLGMFTLWFGVNLHILTIVTGGLATLTFELTLPSAILAILLGNAVGGIFMALHAAQGPQLGVPQMIQSRGQFGSVGSLVVVAFTVFMYLGFVGSNFVLGASSLQQVLPALSGKISIIVIATISAVIAVFGHDLVDLCERWIAVISGIALISCFLVILYTANIPADLWLRGKFSWGSFLAMVAVGAVWQIAYAPYVSDYTRYLPSGTGGKTAFWSSYAGCVLGSIFPMLLGALLGLLAINGQIVPTIVALTGRAGLPIILAFTVAIVCASAVNLYCCALTAITAVQTFAMSWRAGSKARTSYTICLTLIACIMAIAGAESFLNTYENFIVLLLCVMSPWTAINLTDFYLLKHGSYDVSAFFETGGGRYGRYNVAALSAFFLGAAAQVPFLNTQLYTGTITKWLDGADISWLVGLIFTTAIYYPAEKYRMKRT